jgi:hypothetical protein
MYPVAPVTTHGSSPPVPSASVLAHAILARESASSPAATRQLSAG